MKPYINIIGVHSAIGSYLYNDFQSRFIVNGSYRNHAQEAKNIYLDITNRALLETVLPQFNHSFVLLLSALKDVKKCEESYDLAYNINTKPIEDIIGIIEKEQLDIKLIYLSSDYVFDGINGNYSPDDLTNPQTNYGRTKLASESLLKKSKINYKIIRTSACLGPRMSFWEWLLDALRDGGRVELFSNVYFTPTPVNFLSDVLKDIIVNFDNIPDPVLHAAGPFRFSRFEFAQKIQSLLHTGAMLIPVENKFNDNIFQHDLSLKQSEYIKELANINSLDEYLRGPHRGLLAAL
jgi:dTDP-4-dehydrorhamnose reductase